VSGELVRSRRSPAQPLDVAQDAVLLRSRTEPPANLQAEQALLGAILANNKAFTFVSGFLHPEHFFDPLHAAVYAECARRILRGHLVDAVSLKDAFPSHFPTQQEGNAYVAGLLSAMVGIVNAAEYGRAVHDCWLRRQLAEIGATLIAAALQAGDVSGEVQLSQATEALMELSSKAAKDAPMVTIGDAARTAVAQADAARRGENGAVLRSGLAPLDKVIGGLQPAQLYLLGGRPSMGKSSLAIQVMVGCGRSLREEMLNSTGFAQVGGQVLFFSLEMPSEQVGAWAACHIGGITNDGFEGDTERPFTLAEAEKLIEAQRELDALPIHVIDAVGLSGPAIALRARAENQKRRVRLVVVDHVQKLVASLKSTGRFDPTTETARTTSALKDLARQLSCPVIALSQLKAEVDSRDNPRPMLADLMYAGGADADCAVFLYRAERYLDKRPPQKQPKESEEQWARRKDLWEREWAEARDRVEIIGGKRRQGPLLDQVCGFDGARTLFYELGGDPPLL
jgi:replicative DNA helicase